MATPTPDEVAEEVYNALCAFAPAYKPEDLEGWWALGDPPPLGIQSIALVELISYINHWLSDNGATSLLVSGTDVSAATTVGGLVIAAQGKFKSAQAG
jgi:hypothetical protein